MEGFRGGEYAGLIVNLTQTRSTYKKILIEELSRSSGPIHTSVGNCAVYWCKRAYSIVGSIIALVGPPATNQWRKLGGGT